MSSRRSVFMFSIFLIFLFLQGCAVIIMPSFYPRKDRLVEVEIQKPDGWFVSDKVLLVDITGILTSSESSGIFSSTKNMVDEIKEILKKAEDDPSIKSLVLRINSPGGDVTSSDILYNEIREFRKKTGKTVVAEIMGLAASGGYYISLAADKVYAHPTSLTGNIGVIATFPKLEELTSKIGVDVRVIKSGDKKDIGSLWRDFSPEEREILQTVINEYYNRFLNVVKEGRKDLDPNSLATLADGRIFTATQALEAKLIDGIAYLPETIEHARTEAGISDSRVVMYKRPGEYKENIYSTSDIPQPSGAAQTQIGLINVNAKGGIGSPGPQFLYLWLP